MKKKFASFILSNIIFTVLWAQSGDSSYKIHGKRYLVSSGVNIPFSAFSYTHSFGIAADITWSNHQFGMKDKKPVKSFGFIVNGGIDYYFGRERIISMYKYKYGNFTYIHTYAGVIYNPCKKGNIQLSMGPAAGIKDGIVEFWWGINLTASYYLNEKVAITPGIIFMKQSITDPLMSATLRASWIF